LEWETKKAVLWAILLMVAIRVCLLALPFQKVNKILSIISKRPPGRLAPDIESDEISWTVQAAGFLPGATCLTRALAAKVLLAWRKQKTILRIGVAKEGQDALKAHAWLESKGKIVIGEKGIEEYKQLPCFDKVMK
jgi:hypothetical protein